MGRTALISHARGKKHTSRVVLSAKVKKEQHALAAFWHPETEQSDGQEASTSYAPMASATSIEQQRANKLNTETAVKEYQGTHLPLPEHKTGWEHLLYKRCIFLCFQRQCTHCRDIVGY